MQCCRLRTAMPTQFEQLQFEYSANPVPLYRCREFKLLGNRSNEANFWFCHVISDRPVILWHHWPPQTGVITADELRRQSLN